MIFSSALLSSLSDDDVKSFRQAWNLTAPGNPIKTDVEAELVFHVSRTKISKVRLKQRAYSHRWLTERGYPSDLPDELREKAERMYPTKVECVAICVAASSPFGVEMAKIIEKAMTDAVADVYASNKHPDDELVRERILHAKAAAEKAILGRLRTP